MPDINLRKQQKADLARYITNASLDVADFKVQKVTNTNNPDGAYVVTHNELDDRFVISKKTDKSSSEDYFVTLAYPGSVQEHERYRHDSWPSVLSTFNSWLDGVSSELEAVDPWEEADQQMEDDTSNFSLEELPKIDNAIDVSLDELKTIALNNGKKLEEVEASIEDAKSTLKSLARKVNKSEWLGIFKSVGVGLLAEWGINTELFKSVLQVLFNSASDIAQLTEHAAKYLLQ